MKYTLIAPAAVVAITLGTAAPSNAQSGPVGRDVVIAPEQRTLIKEYVMKEHVAPVTVQERVAVGAKIPANVELRTVPSGWGPSVAKYRYIYSDNHVYFVEPSSREVVSVIE